VVVVRISFKSMSSVPCFVGYKFLKDAMYKLEIELQRIKKLQGCDFSDPATQREVFSLLETLFGMILELRKENQELRDEINRLKGEKGKPTFKPNNDLHLNRGKGDGTLEPGLTKKWVKGSKRARIKIDRTEVIELDRSNLPDDIEFKGYEEKVIQNIILKTDNVLYRLEKYYSPSLKKTYTAELENSLKNTEFGAETKALISALYYENRVTENKIASFLNANGLRISEGTVSNILIKAENEALNVIKNKVFEAGLASSVYQQIDDTGMKISKKNAYATIVCNEKHSTFFINTSKSRETIRTFMPSCLSSMFTVLVGDDAPQFKGISERYGLCWVHEERHYKKLTPILEYHRKELSRVRDEIWSYYAKLKGYKESPTEQKKIELWDEFDVLFGQKTYYDE
jgi:hypothetical protein